MTHIEEEIHSQASAELVRLTQHAQQEMVEDSVSFDELIEALSTGRILENYPDHNRGACCLLYGQTSSGRDLHIVCTTGQPILIIITVYVPTPPKWMTPTQRGTRS